MVNPFFNNYRNRNEQNLVHDLMREAIAFAGHDVYYLPRFRVNVDDILNETETALFNDAVQTDVYVKNFNSFEGDGVLLGKFGIEVRDEIMLTIAVRTFERDVMENVNLERPREGDLVWVPFLNAAYEIRHVENASLFFQMGDVQTYDLTCELFEFSQEIFRTGVFEIDQHFHDQYNVLEERSILSSEGDVLSTVEGGDLSYRSYSVEEEDKVADNDQYDKEDDAVLDWSERNPFGEL